MLFRRYEQARDKEAARRIWREVGWLADGKEELSDGYVNSGKGFVAEIDGEAESLVTTAPGTIRYLKEDLPASFVTGVTTSRVARKQGIAARLAAKAIADDAREGALLAALGMFEQGFYNQIGFGTGSYEHIVSFDPVTLLVPNPTRPPRRIRPGDWEIAHKARLTRRQAHGHCNLHPVEMTSHEMLGESRAFGLGYFDGPGGELTHYFWCDPGDSENGPYRIEWLIYQTDAQFLELMSVIKSLGDQVHQVRLTEPSGIQLQDLIRQPLKQRKMTDKGKYPAANHAIAYWQMRLCNLEESLARTHLHGATTRFHLLLTDPIENYLDDSEPWCGLSGDYIVTIGPESSAERGTDASLPTLTASVGAFTRLWLGVRPATGLAVTDTLAGPPDLLEQLDWTLRLPEPKPDWDF